MKKLRHFTAVRYHVEIGKRFRQFARNIQGKKIDLAFSMLQDAYEGLQYSAKLASHEGLLNRAETMKALAHEARGQVGGIVKSACSLYRQLTIDAERDHFRARLTAQSSVDGLSPQDIQQLIGHEMTEAELGARIVREMDALSDLLREPVEPPHKAIYALTIKFRDAVVSEFGRLEIARICEECGRAFALTRSTKRHCSPGFEDRNCAAIARGKRSYEKRARASMSRSESARKAARARWALPHGSIR